MDSMRYLQLVRRWWWLVVLLAALGGAAGYVVSKRTPVVYAASTTLLVVANKPTTDTSEGLIPDQQAALVKTYKELLLKWPVLQAVITNLGLPTDLLTLAKQVSVQEVRDTQLLVLTAEDESPERAAAIANATVQAFNQQAATLLANPYVTNRAGLSVVEDAVAPVEPKGPGPLRTIAIATLVGVMLAAGIALALEYFNSAVRTSEDVTLLTELPTLAEIGRLGGPRAQKKLVTLHAPHTSEAEVYRMLRLYLESAVDGGAMRTLIVTSARPREGKSVTAANLAIALAQTGLRTILIDTNLRCPVVHDLFQVPNNRGVTTALRRDATGPAYDHTVESGVENLRLLLSGPQPDAGILAPARLLVPNRLQSLTEEFKAHADVLIFDSPSVLDVVETTLLARSCDAALLVVQAERTPAQALLQTSELLKYVRVSILGIVLNRVARPSPNTPGHYYLNRRKPLLERGRHLLEAAQSRRTMLPPGVEDADEHPVHYGTNGINTSERATNKTSHSISK